MPTCRRRVIAVGAALLASPLPTFAQSRRLRVGFLGGIAPDASTQRAALDPFRQGLRDLGYLAGQNLEIHYRWAEGQPDRLPALAAELLALNLDVLVTMGPGPAFAAKAATTAVPVVATVVDNPVLVGLIADFSRPGGNVTGISSFGSELVAKRLQLLKELVPAIRRVAILMNPATTTRASMEELLREFGRQMGLSIQLLEARTPDQFTAAFDAMARERAEGILVLADATFWTHRARLHDLVAKSRLPSVWGHRDYLIGGGLASYQADYPPIFKRAAAMVDAIAKGAKPAVTPFEQATKLELVINLKSAKELGISVPQSLLVAADDVIR